MTEERQYDEVHEERIRRLSERAHERLGERLGDSHINDERVLELTVIDLTDEDIATAEDDARQLGVPGAVRVRAADPADIAAWARLRHELSSLWESETNPVVASPTPQGIYQRPPVPIGLTAGATPTAADLHARYGSFVALQVGALPYPPQAAGPVTRPARAPRPRLDPADVRAELAGALTVQSGTSGHHRLRLTNLTGTDVVLRTNGRVTAFIVDPDSGDRVGGFSGPQIAPLVRYTAPAGGSVEIPLLIGTASFRIELGYAVPPGRWDLMVPLTFEDGRTFDTPPLPFTIVA